ncbi:THAP domain-containing protein 1 isoform X1 [Ooceraea biroi]|uniref:THAP domain-containing protein 1 isoform X1 n=1 Tax=Ooceraea biroi TaxID=2015173 RepID=UPI0005BC2342|nr:THAP domain-containing protein 1 isoform X1 [Ooceraea biroi]
MVVCCICGIEWMPDSVSFHKFPKSDNIRNRWLAAINKRITNFTLNKHAKICGQHFALECFIVTETGKRYLKSYAVPSIFDMPLKKKYILTQSVRTDEGDLAITNEEPCSEVTVGTNEVAEDNSQESSVSIVKDPNLTELDTVHSGIFNISVIKEEVIIEDHNADQHEIVPNTSHEELHSEIMSVKENRANGSTTRRQRATKYGTIHSGIVDISLVNKELVDAQRATEKCNVLLRKKLKNSQQKCRRLQRKVTFLTLLIKHLQNKMLSQDSAKSLEVNSE